MAPFQVWRRVGLQDDVAAAGKTSRTYIILMFTLTCAGPSERPAGEVSAHALYYRHCMFPYTAVVYRRGPNVSFCVTHYTNRSNEKLSVPFALSTETMLINYSVYTFHFHALAYSAEFAVERRRPRITSENGSLGHKVAITIMYRLTPDVVEEG